MIKKGKGLAARKPNKARPTKADAPPPGRVVRSTRDAYVPSYDGPKKTDKKPSAKGRRVGRIKAAFKTNTVRQPRPAPFEDQIAGSSRQKPSTREQYIRLRIRVHNDRLSVIDSHLVDGPLSQTNTFSGAHAYEVTLGNQLLHAGALPDIGVQRSFINPTGPPEEHGHYFTERPIYEFMARLPAHEVSRESIGRISVRLYRVKEEVRTDRLGSAPLARQFERHVRQIGEIVGLPPSVLPNAIEKRGGRTPST